MTGEFITPCRCEGLRHARNLVTKQWQKEKQRAEDLRKLADERAKEIEDLKRRLKFLEDRYL